MFAVAPNYKQCLQFCSGFLLWLVLPVFVFSAEIKLVADPISPLPGTDFTVAVIVIYLEPVAGIDLRWQFESVDVAGTELQAKKLAEFSWHQLQNNPEQGWAITGLMLPQLGQAYQFQANDTLAIFHFRRLNGNRTSISLKSGYPILIDGNLSPVSCIVNPLVLETVSSVIEYNGSPADMALQVSNYPNPFNPETQFVIQSGQASPRAEIVIFDLTGREISRCKFTTIRGTNIISWPAVDLNNQPVPAGIYFYHVQINQQIAQGKCVIIK